MLNYSPKCQRKLKTNAVPTKPIVSYNILPQFILNYIYICIPIHAYADWIIFESKLSIVIFKLENLKI